MQSASSLPLDQSIEISTTSFGSISHQSSAVSLHSQTDLHAQIPKNLLSVMSKYGERMEKWDFDVFEMMDDPLLCNKGLTMCTFYLFRKIGILKIREFHNQIYGDF